MIFLLEKHLNRCILSLLRHATSPPHSDDGIVELSESVHLSLVGQNLQELGRETIGSYRLSVRQRIDCLLYFVPIRDIAPWSARGPLLKLVHNAWFKGRRLGVKHFMKPPHPPLTDMDIIPQQSTFLVYNVLRVERPVPFHIHPLEVFVEANLITFSDTPFELAYVIFENLSTASARVRFSCLVVAFKARRRPRSSVRAERTRFLASSPSCHRAFNSVFVSSVAHKPLSSCLRRIRGTMSAAFDTYGSVSNEVMPSTLPALIHRVSGGQAWLLSRFRNSSGDACPPLILVDQELAGF